MCFIFGTYGSWFGTYVIFLYSFQARKDKFYVLIRLEFLNEVSGKSFVLGKSSGFQVISSICMAASRMSLATTQTLFNFLGAVLSFMCNLWAISMSVFFSVTSLPYMPGGITFMTEYRSVYIRFNSCRIVHVVCTKYMETVLYQRSVSEMLFQEILITKEIRCISFIIKMKEITTYLYSISDTL